MSAYLENTQSQPIDNALLDEAEIPKWAKSADGSGVGIALAAAKDDSPLQVLETSSIQVAMRHFCWRSLFLSF